MPNRSTPTELPSAARRAGKTLWLRSVAHGVAVIAAVLSVASSAATSDADSRQLGLPAADDLPVSLAQIEMGRMLFFDKRLSRDGDISCASCHQPEKAFSDGRAIAHGTRGAAGTRNTPSLLNVRFNTSQFWDGRRASLEDQAGDPFVNPREHGLDRHASVESLVRDDVAYQAIWSTLTGGGKNITPEISHIAAALAAYERTLLAGDSAFDRYFYGGKSDALSDSARRGFELFRGRAQCASCHTIGTRAALFTDQKFHRLGIGHDKLGPRLAELSVRVSRVHSDARQTDELILREPEVSELGRFVVTLSPQDIGRFKTPSLRNVALTGPYMHDGSVATLAEAVERELYYRGVEAGRPLILTPAEKRDLVEFLNALTSIIMWWRDPVEVAGGR